MQASVPFRISDSLSNRTKRFLSSPNFLSINEEIRLENSLPHLQLAALQSLLAPLERLSPVIVRHVQVESERKVEVSQPGALCSGESAKKPLNLIEPLGNEDSLSIVKWSRLYMDSTAREQEGDLVAATIFSHTGGNGEVDGDREDVANSNEDQVSQGRVSYDSFNLPVDLLAQFRRKIEEARLPHGGVFV